MRYFLKITYDGTDFHGWQVQPGQPTIQQKLNDSLSKILQQSIQVTGCGRTDAGVHASEYYLHFDSNKQAENKLIYQLNSVLPDSIAVLELIPVKDDQHARFDAYKRSYTYHIHFEKNPFLNRFSYHCYYRKLTIEKMKRVAESLIQYSDFSPLSKDNEDVKSTICSIYQSELIIKKGGKQLELKISANRFLHNMIRRIVGLLISVGREKISEEEVIEVMSNSAEFSLNFVAPPEGLFLSGVNYRFINE